MANGPPTPPPTTAAEIQDEEKEKGAAAVAVPIASAPASPQAQPRQDYFLLAFPTIASLASEGKFHELVQFAEQTELNGDADRQQTRLLLTAPLILAYLILDNLSPARYALTRLPESLFLHPLAQALLNILASTWERNHARVYSRADDLFHMINQPNFLDAKLGLVIARMLAEFLESFRHRTFGLLSKAYFSIPLSLAQTYLGLPADQLLAIVKKHRWSYDASTHILTPFTVDSITSSDVNSDAQAPSSLATFQLVASSVAKLEI